MEDRHTSSAPNPGARSAPSDAPRSEQRPGRGRFTGIRAPRVCPYCKDKVKFIDYKNVDQLRRFLTDRAKIKARRKIGTCSKHQRRLAIAIKRARHIALLPFTPLTYRVD